ncbi:MAG: AI-2E family transporter [Lachnospiraceae bacterium]|nr:AI-2E family transporter [Lachnospiraceae bacterium]
MQREPNSRKVAQWVVGGIIVAAFTILLFFGLFKFSALRDTLDLVLKSLQSVVIGLVIAYLINPAMVFIEKIFFRIFCKDKAPSDRMKKVARGVAVVLSLLLLLAVVIILIFMLVPQLIESITTLINQVPGQTQNVIRLFNEVLDSHSAWATENEELSETVNSYVTSLSDYAVNWLKENLLGSVNQVITTVTSGVIIVVKFLFNLIVGLIVSIYVLCSKEKLLGTCKKIVYALRKQEAGDEVVATGRHINEIFSGFISGKILDSLIIGVLCFIGVTILNMPYPLLISVIIGVTNVIPFFGPYIGAVPTALIVLIYNPVQGLIYILFILILQQFDGNILGPKILGDSTGLSSFWVIFAILLGGGMFGVPGMILGVPTFASVYYLIKKYMERRLKAKNLPADTSWYAVPGEMRTEGIEEELAREAAMAEEDVSAKPQDSRADGKAGETAAKNGAHGGFFSGMEAFLKRFSGDAKQAQSGEKKVDTTDPGEKDGGAAAGESENKDANAAANESGK